MTPTFTLVTELTAHHTGTKSMRIEEKLGVFIQRSNYSIAKYILTTSNKDAVINITVVLFQYIMLYTFNYNYAIYKVHISCRNTVK